MKREDVMRQLYITEQDILDKPLVVQEKLFAVSIINQGTEIAHKILTKYLELRDLLEGR